MRSKFKWIFTLIVALTMQLSFSQEKTVTGTVSDATGTLPGANVVVKGTTRGVETNVDGKFSISAKQGDVLVVSFVGMQDKSVTVGAASNYNVKLSAGQELNTVVVGALGIKRKADAVTSSQQVVRTKELTQAANPNVIQSLSGKVSGLQINTSSNGVNAGTRIVLRGNRSISGNNEALVVIDGAISSANVLAQLPPEVIENVNVIKGAQGAALYGEQGTNGVLIVTTKKGSKDSKMSVDINSAVDFETIAYLPKRQTKYGQGWADDQSFSFGAGDLRDGQNFVPFENGAWGPAFDNPDFVGQQVPVGLPQADGNFFLTDWKSLGSDNIKKFFQTGTTFQNGVTVNVGGEDSYVLLNLKRQNTDFVVRNDKLDRTSFLLKAGKKYNKFTIDGNASFTTTGISETNQDSDGTRGGLLDQLLQAATNIPVERFANSGHINNWTIYAANPYRLVEQIRQNTKSNTFNGVVSFGYEFNKNISVNYTLNAQTRNNNVDQHDDGIVVDATNINLGPYSYSPFGSNITYSDFTSGQPSSFYNTQNTRNTYYSDLIFNFNYDLTKDINAKFNIGNNIQDSYFRSIKNGGTNLDVPGFYNITNVLNPDLPASANLRPFNVIQKVRRVAAFANADFGYKDFLFLNATGRYEQSSTVANAFFYPSVGVSFIPTKAISALKDGSFLNYMKLSASIVKNGNTTPVDIYATNNLAVSTAGFPFSDLAGFQVNRTPADPGLTPEFVTTKEANISLGFLHDRITLDGSYYIADTKDLITRISASTPSGLQAKLGNIGSLQNKGFEIDLGITPIKTQNFTWNMKGSYSTSKTIVKSLAAGNDLVNIQSNTFIGIFAEVGQEFPLIKGTKYVRDPNGNIVVNANGLPLRTSTFEKLGKANPDYIINFSNSLNYKGLQLSAVVDYRTGHSIYNEQVGRLATFGYLEESADQDRTQPFIVPNSVQELTPGVFTPNTTSVNGVTNPVPYSALLNYYSANYSRTGEALLLDATALKVRELALSYTIPTKVFKNTGIEGFKIGINARNPFVKLAKNNKGYTDPEASNANTGTTRNGVGISEIGQYPTTKTYGFSLNLTF